MWKTRNELPGLVKLDIKYNIGMLRRDVEDYLLNDLKDLWRRVLTKIYSDAYG